MHKRRRTDGTEVASESSFATIAKPEDSTASADHGSGAAVCSQPLSASSFSESKRAGGCAFARLSESLLGSRVLSFCSAQELLLVIELVCQRFRLLSLAGTPWRNETVHWSNFVQLVSSCTFEMMAFCASGRLRHVSELTVRSPLPQLTWLRADKVPRLRSLTLCTHPFVHLLPTALDSLRPFKQLTVRACVCGLPTRSRS